MNYGRLVESIRQHEGYRREPYRDHLGFWTTGYGHLLHDRLVPSKYHTLGELLDWLSDKAQHEKWFESDVAGAIAIATSYVQQDTWDTLSSKRQEVLAELAFQLGNRLRGFVKLKAALEAGDWQRAAEELLASRWAQQTPNRARNLIEKFLAG